MQVCKLFFLCTLGFSKSNDAVVRRVLNQSVGDKPKISHSGRPEKFDKSIIEKHVMLYHPSISHYRREHAPNRLYLPSELTTTSLYNDYVANGQPKCSYETFRIHVKNKMKTSFAKLGHEECEDCE